MFQLHIWHLERCLAGEQSRNIFILQSARKNCEVCLYPLSISLLIKKYPTAVITTEYHLFIIMRQYQRKHHMAQSRIAMQFSFLGITKAIRNYLIFLGERQSKIKWHHPLHSDAFRHGLYHLISAIV